MIRLWLCALARKFVVGRKLQTRSCLARRWSVRLRLEALEDRTVASTLSLEPPGPAAGAATIAYDQFKTPSVNLPSAVDDAANPTAPGGRALERLLKDVQSIEP